jgi:hypothetical protein
MQRAAFLTICRGQKLSENDGSVSNRRFNKVVLADGTIMRDTQTGADDGGRAATDVGR